MAESTTLQHDNYQISDDNYADRARAVMANAQKQKQDKRAWFNRLSTTKLRGIYAQIVNISSKVTSKEDFEKDRGDIQYLKVKMAYEAGRANEVKDFLGESHLLSLLDDLKTFDQLQLYSRYAESLVAYFVFYGGKE